MPTVVVGILAHIMVRIDCTGRIAGQANNESEPAAKTGEPVNSQLNRKIKTPP